jgi:hypothetical protein
VIRGKIIIYDDTNLPKSTKPLTDERIKEIEVNFGLPLLEKLRKEIPILSK